MDKLGLEKGQVIEHPWVAGSIEIAQRRVEQHNFEIRKQLLEYDNVMNKQREIIYTQRRSTLEGASLKENILEIIDSLVEAIVSGHVIENQETDLAALNTAIKLKFAVELDPAKLSGQNKHDLTGMIINEVEVAYEEKEKSVGTDLLRHLERMVFLQIIDAKWKDHLYAMDSLREGIGLRAYGQRDPLVEYKREAFNMFSQMMSGIEEEAVETIFKLHPAKQDKFKGVFSSAAQELLHPEAGGLEGAAAQAAQEDESPIIHSRVAPKPVQLSGPKVGRNDPCPCGSGKKFKKCCGA
ncbi:MAG: SEC-C metal-binding domain-containing protein [Candidatus Omnitrophica bacterium]|nr:SEC-C metal-binding domain-containing protein [Candidatus Omnitrophota bacterium]